MNRPALAAREYPCPTCGAARGERCRNLFDARRVAGTVFTARRTRVAHKARTVVAREARR